MVGDGTEVMMPGHKRGRQCSICKSDKRERVNAMLVAGVFQKKIAADYGFSMSAIQRHKRRHMSVCIQDPERAVESEDGEYIRNLKALFSRAARTMDEAFKEPALALAAGREARRLIETMAKVSGIIGDGTTVNVQQNMEVNEKWVVIRTAMMRALAKHPEALDDVIVALAEAEALEPSA